jgi:hypothetical protein
LFYSSGLVLFSFVIASCNVESQFRIANPEALSSLVAAGNDEPNSARLVIFTDGQGRLTIQTRQGRKESMSGRVDMLGESAGKYPEHFDLVLKAARVRFLQPELADVIQVIGVD